MNRKQNIELLNKLNILKGYLVDDGVVIEEVLKLSRKLFDKDLVNYIIGHVEQEDFSSALNLLNDQIRSISKSIFSNPCDKNWNDLLLTNEKNTKFCTDCNKNVFLVLNEEDFLKRKNLQQCVALNTKYFDSSKKDEVNFKSCRIKFFDDPYSDNDILLGTLF